MLEQAHYVTEYKSETSIWYSSRRQLLAPASSEVTWDEN